MNHRAFLRSGFAGLLVCLSGSWVSAADDPAAGPVDQATIYFSAAPWDGAAYDLEIPMKRVDDVIRPNIRITIWDYPEFPESTTIRFSGEEDAGGGPRKGDGVAYFQSNLNKSMPERLAGSISFKTLKHGSPVSGSYEFATLDGKRKFKGSFKASWGNKPERVIR